MRSDTTHEKQQLAQKLEELKGKYEENVDELTQSKINFERDKALKD